MIAVKQFGSDWKTVLRSTKTDEKGHFAMTKVKDRKVYFLQFSFRNCNPIRVRVKVDAEHGKELQVQMVNSSSLRLFKSEKPEFGPAEV